MEVRRVNNYTYDLFLGNGWGSHTRVRQGKRNTYVVSGDSLSKPLLKDLHDILHPTMPISYGQTVEEMLRNFNAI